MSEYSFVNEDLLLTTCNNLITSINSYNLVNARDMLANNNVSSAVSVTINSLNNVMESGCSGCLTELKKRVFSLISLCPVIVQIQDLERIINQLEADLIYLRSNKTKRCVESYDEYDEKTGKYLGTEYSYYYDYDYELIAQKETKKSDYTRAWRYKVADANAIIGY